VGPDDSARSFGVDPLKVTPRRLLTNDRDEA
jgi:hypothetical protein